jgi:hypothetical protein
VCNIIAIPVTLKEAHVDCLFKLAIQESGFDIKLLGDEPIRREDGQEKGQRIETYNRRNRLMVILSLKLGKLWLRPSASISASIGESHKSALVPLIAYRKKFFPIV